MQQLINTLTQLRRLKDKSVKENTVALAQQRQVCTQYDSNIKSLKMLVGKSGVDNAQAPSIESYRNIDGYRHTLHRVIRWQEQEKVLAQIKENRIRKNLVQAACKEKIIALSLDEQQDAWSAEINLKEQKTLDEIATQCWARQQLRRDE